MKRAFINLFLFISLPLWGAVQTIETLLLQKGVILQSGAAVSVDFNHDRAIQGGERVPDANGDGIVVTKEILDFAVVNAADERILRDILSVFSEPADSFAYPEVYKSAAQHYKSVVAKRLRELSLREFTEEYGVYKEIMVRQNELAAKREAMIKETYDVSVIRTIDGQIAREGLLREQSGARLSMMGAHPLMNENQFYLPDGELVRIADRRSDIALHNNGAIKKIKLYRPLERAIVLNKKEQKITLEGDLELYPSGMWKSFTVKDTLSLNLRGKAVEKIKKIFLTPSGAVGGYSLAEGDPVFFDAVSSVEQKNAVEGESAFSVSGGARRTQLSRNIHFATIGSLFVSEMYKLDDTSWYRLDPDKSPAAKVKFLGGRIEAPANAVYALTFEKGILSGVIFKDSARPAYSSTALSRVSGAPQLFSESRARITRIMIDDTIRIYLNEPLLVVDGGVRVEARPVLELTRSGEFLSTGP